MDGCRCTETGMLDGLVLDPGHRVGKINKWRGVDLFLEILVVLDLAGGEDMFFWEVCVFMCWGLLSWNLAGGQRRIFFWVRVRD